MGVVGTFNSHLIGQARLESESVLPHTFVQHFVDDITGISTSIIATLHTTPYLLLVDTTPYF